MSRSPRRSSPGATSASHRDVCRFYGLGHCTTCQAVYAWLAEEGIGPVEFHDLKDEPLSHADVARLAAAVGGAEKLFSKRALKYRAMGLHQRTLTAAEMLDLMVEEYTFITRPVIEWRGVTTVSSHPSRLAPLLAAREELCPS